MSEGKIVYIGGYEKAAHLYDVFDRKENIEFFLHYGLEAGEILDIGAGTGRIAIPLAEKGISVFCVEPSPAMRRELMKKLAKRPDLVDRIELSADDAAHFGFGRTFQAAFLSGSFDHFLKDEERLSSLKNIGGHLNTGGKLVFDIFLGLMKNSPLSPAGKATIGKKEYRRFVAGHLLPDGTKEVMLVFETWLSGNLMERIEEHSMVGTVDRKRIHHLLTKAGFEVKKEFRDYDFSEYHKEDSLLIVEAVKRK